MATNNIYDSQYYATMRGAEHFSEGRISQFYSNFVFSFPGRIEGAKVLDIGCGRGELLQLLLRKGAAFAYGVDYSRDAISIASDFLHKCGSDSDRYLIKEWDVTTLDETLLGKIDYIFMLDVVEHLPQADLEKAIKNCLLYLKDGGELHFHTFPTALPHSLLMGALRFFNPSQKVEIEKIHVNVQNRKSITRIFESCGFRLTSLRLENDFLLTSSFYNKMQESPIKKLLKLFFGGIASSRIFRKLSRLARVEELFFMSIYGVAVKRGLDEKYA